MWIRMRTTAAGAKLPHALHADETYNVNDELAEHLIEAGAAFKVNAPASHARKSADETAALNNAGETTDANQTGDKPSLHDRLSGGADGKTPEELTAEGVAFVVSGGYTEEAAKKLVAEHGAVRILAGRDLVELLAQDDLEEGDDDEGDDENKTGDGADQIENAVKHAMAKGLSKKQAVKLVKKHGAEKVLTDTVHVK
jgi:hypothetical protein